MKPGAERTLQRASTLLAGLVTVLAAKGVADVWNARDRFPAWFAPCFAVGVAALVVAVGAVVLQRPRPEDLTGIGRAPRGVVWTLLVASFPCTTSVHAFKPFAPGVVAMWERAPSLRLNLALAVVGVVVTLACAVADARGRAGAALGGLLVLAPVLLWPNDDCANPFNVWWIDAIGASPLMYVPNALAILFGVAALRGVRPRWNTLCLAVVCLAALVLGLGHRTRLIW
jgi:hypothetical protein